MAIVHKTTLKPTKLELLASWLPDRPWYRGAGTPVLTNAGGFRLDDPDGEVGIELMIVTDAASPDVDGYLVPMTYRAEPLEDAEDALIGTTEHGVLGTRYVYDAPADPVFRAQLAALVQGDAQPQAQSESDQAEPSVQLSAMSNAAGADLVRVLVASEATPIPGEVSVPWRRTADTEVRGIIARAF